MEQYSSNSHKSKEEKKVEKVISGLARQKKKGEFRKIVDCFIAEDLHDIKSYILKDVIAPAVKKAVWDVVTNGADMLIYGETNHTKKSSNVSYRNYYDKSDTRRDYHAPVVKTGFSFDDIILDTRGEAEGVLERMDELISAYGIVSVADLYDLVGVTGDYTYNKYGWTDIHSASVMRVRDGYMLKLPKALPIN
ncbi:hypothetical protein AGMMS49975_12430 [Clostridia bacterium]|nr:hypothetical protein AGMMS49975_12430 [Clostridia bacterium]